MDNLSLSDIAAVTEGRNDGMFGGGSWAVVLIILFLIISLMTALMYWYQGRKGED